MEQNSHDSTYRNSLSSSSNSPKIHSNLLIKKEPKQTKTVLSSMISDTNLKRKISIKDYEIGEEVGRGALGRVYLARDIVKGTQVAIKVVEKKFINLVGRAHQAMIEKEILRNLDHPNIIHLHNTFQTKDKLYYVLDYAPNGDLSSFIRRHQTYDVGVVQFYAAEIVNVLNYLHNIKKIAHRDLKPENILLDYEMHIKLIDFSTATIEGKYFDRKTLKFVPKKREDEGAYNSELVGTAEYVSPEMIDNTVSNQTATDLWALGCIIYKFFHGETPFKGVNDEETMRNIKSGEFTMRKDIPESGKDLITKLLCQDPKMRLGVLDSNYTALKCHPFFNGISFESLETTDIKSIMNIEKNLTNQSQSTLAESIVSHSSSENSFDSLILIPKQSNDIKIYEWEIENYIDEFPTQIEDYFFFFLVY